MYHTTRQAKSDQPAHARSLTVFTGRSVDSPISYIYIYAIDIYRYIRWMHIAYIFL